MRRVEEIKSATEDGVVDPAALTRAVEVVESSTPIGAVMATVATDEFMPALIEAAEERSVEHELAWLTMAAVGPDRARRVLAKRAAAMVDPGTLIEVLIEHGDELRHACDAEADHCGDDERQGAWSLLGTMTAPGLESVVWSSQALRSRYLAARSRKREERALRRDASSGEAPALALSALAA
jgi:hypothetical protein